MSRIMVITSGKGGVGKTTVTANLGLTLGILGIKTCVIDLDIGLNNLDLALMVENKVLYDLSDVLSGKCRLKQALIPCPQTENLFALSCNNQKAKDLLVEHLESILNKLTEHFDFILIDSPAGIDHGFNNAISHAHEALVVVTPHLSSLRDSDRVLGLLAGKHLNKVSLVINRIRGDMVQSKLMISASEIEKQLKTKAAGIIPELDELCANSHFSFTDNISEARDAFFRLARNITHDENIHYDYLAKYRGLSGFLNRILKKKA